MGRINNFLVNFNNLRCDLKIVKARREALKIFMSKAYTKDVVPVNEEVAGLKQIQSLYQNLITDDSKSLFILKDKIYDSNKKITIDDLVGSEIKEDVFVPENLIESTKEKKVLINEITNNALVDLYLKVDNGLIKSENLSDLQKNLKEKEVREEYFCLPVSFIKKQDSEIKNFIKSIENKVLKEDKKNKKNYNKAEYFAQNYNFFKSRVVDWLKKELDFFRDNPTFTEQAVENFVSYLYGDKALYNASLVEKKNFENTLQYHYFDSIKEPGIRKIHDWFIAQGVMNQKAELVLKGVFHRLRFQETFSCSLFNYVVHKIKKQTLFEEKNVTYFELGYVNDSANVLFEEKKKEFNQRYKIDDLIKKLFKIDSGYAIFDNNRLNEILHKNEGATSKKTKKLLGFSEEVYEKRRISVNKQINPNLKYLLPRVYKDIAQETIENINRKIEGYGLELRIGYVYIDNK